MAGRWPDRLAGLKGRRLAFEKVDAGGSNITVMDLELGTETRLGTPGFNGGEPIWTPDGSRITYWIHTLFRRPPPFRCSESSRPGSHCAIIRASKRCSPSTRTSKRVPAGRE